MTKRKSWKMFKKNESSLTRGAKIRLKTSLLIRNNTDQKAAG